MKKNKIFIIAAIALIVCLSIVAIYIFLIKPTESNDSGGQKQTTQETQDAEETQPPVKHIEWITNNAGENVGKIYTDDGLFEIADNPDKTYELCADIDMENKSWLPIEIFSGKFNGNGHTISNLSISSDSNGNMGLFGEISSEGKVENLNLSNVKVTSTESSVYHGTFAGKNAGEINNCTSTGQIKDERPDKFYGAISGHNTGKIIGGNTLCIGSYKYENYNGIPKNIIYSGNLPDTDLLAGATGLTSVIELPFGAENTGITASGDTSSVSGIWCDITYRTYSETEQQKREATVSYMYKMGTVVWSPSNDFSYISKGNSANTHSNAFLAGKLYVGLPYNHGGGSLERFLSKTESGLGTQDSPYVAVNGLQNGEYTLNTILITGFAQYMGNDCSSSIGWAWSKISHIRQGNGSGYYGAFARGTGAMVPGTENTVKYGMQPVGSYTNNTTTKNTATIIKNNGLLQDMAENYALAGYGDALVCYENGSHARMVASLPVVIRNSDGTIDLEKSYFITHEQGDGLYDLVDSDGNPLNSPEIVVIDGKRFNVKYTSWRTNYKYTFNDLLNGTTDTKSSGSNYIPVTIAAFKHTGEDNLYSEVTQKITSPSSGKVYFHHRLLRAVLTVKNTEGQKVGSYTAYSAVGSSSSIYRDTRNFIDLSILFDGYENCLVNNNSSVSLNAGQEYLFEIVFEFADGRTLSLNELKDRQNNVLTPISYASQGYIEFKF